MPALRETVNLDGLKYFVGKKRKEKERRGRDVILTEDFCRSRRVCLRRPGLSKRNYLSPRIVLILEAFQGGKEKICSPETV